MKIRLKKSGCERLIKAIDAYIQKVDDEIENALTDAGFVDPKQTMKDIGKLEKELKKLLDENTKFVLNSVYDYDDVGDFIVNQWPELKGNKDLIEKLTKTFESHLMSVMPKYVADYISRTDPQLKALGLTHQTQAWIHNWSGKLAEIMQLTDNNAIEKILSRAMQEGKSVADTAREIADSGIRDSGYRARRTSTTEMLRAHSVAQQESFMQSPAVVSKMWRHSGWRQYSRQNHIDIDGQTVRKEDTFTLFGDEGIFYPMYPRDECLPAGESINCGCIAEPIVDDNILHMSLDERRQLQKEAIAEIDAEYDRKNDFNPKQSEEYWHKPTVEDLTQGGIINPRSHFSERLHERGLTEEAVIDAINKPLIKLDRGLDEKNRRSVKYIGKEATVCVNPDTGVITTTWKTGTKTRKKYERKTE